jgi:hypothetical protein
LIVACGLIAVVSLGIALQAARYAHSASARGPLQAEISQAESIAIAQRWERAPLGQIFPASVGYTTGQGTSETATRLGIGAGDSCAAALDSTLVDAADGFGCVAALRASYVDELYGTVYTVGVIVFPDDQAARAFHDSVPPGAGPTGTGLNTLQLPGTAAALFTDSARQTLDSSVTGTYVVLSVSGYADGRPATTSDEPQDTLFSPAGQIVQAVVAALSAPQPVHCGDGEFAC